MWFGESNKSNYKIFLRRRIALCEDVCSLIIILSNFVYRFTAQANPTAVYSTNPSFLRTISPQRKTFTDDRVCFEAQIIAQIIN